MNITPQILHNKYYSMKDTPPLHHNLYTTKFTPRNANHKIYTRSTPQKKYHEIYTMNDTSQLFTTQFTLQKLHHGYYNISCCLGSRAGVIPFYFISISGYRSGSPPIPTTRQSPRPTQSPCRPQSVPPHSYRRRAGCMVFITSCAAPHVQLH